MTKLRHVKPLLRNGLCCRKKTQIVTLPKTTGIPQSTEIEPISRGHNARGQGHKKNPRPRIAPPRTDPLEAKDRNARGQGPRTQAQVFSKKLPKDWVEFSKDCKTELINTFQDA